MTMRRKLQEILDGEIYGRVMTVVIIASLVPLCFKEESMAFDIVEYVATAIFVIDYIARISTADFKLGKGKVSFLIYPFTPMAIIDLISILPTFVSISPAFRALRTLRIFRAARAFKLIRYSKSMNALANVFVKQRSLLMTVLLLAVAYVMITAIVIFNIEPYTFETFFDALYWSVVSLTTVGYGDLYPTSEAGRFIAMLSSLAGIAVIAMPSGIITAGLISELESGKDGNQQ